MSELACESLREPGSWRCLEIVYRNEPRKLLDRFFLSSSSARGARNRLEVLKREICEGIRETARVNNPVRLISYGSGPGHEILACVDTFRGEAAVEGVCVDRDQSALRYGHALAVGKGLEGQIRYVQGDVLCMEAAGQHDLAILSGLIDYFGFETAVSVLTRIREQLRPGGTVLLANMRHHRLASVMSVLGNWHLVYREPEEVRALLAESGYQQICVWVESTGVFCIGKGKKRTSGNSAARSGS